MEVVVIEKVFELPSILDGVDHSPLFLHPPKVLFHALDDINPPEEPVEKPVQKEARLVIKHIGI